MTISRRTVLAGSAIALARSSVGWSQALAQGNAPIRIGEINSYSAIPAFTLPYRNGWQLAVEQLNTAGGVLGRPVEVISRDAAANAARFGYSEAAATCTITPLFRYGLNNRRPPSPNGFHP